MLRGVDISNWQKGVSTAGLDAEFVIAKATEGNYFVDPYCDGYIQGCISSGKLWGFYHFAREADAAEEARFFYENCTGYNRKGIPVLDYEVWGINYDDVAWCERFMTTYHDLAGVWPILYISASHCPDFANSWIPQTCGLWLAGYPYEVPSDYSCPYDCWPWEFIAIWQFASDHRVNGYLADIDGDVAYMDAHAWGLYAGTEQQAAQQSQEPTTAEKKVLTGRVTIELD